MTLRFPQSLLLVVLLMPTYSTAAAAQSRPAFEGMWSDPPPTAEDLFCLAWCTDAGLARLGKLLDDPANDSRPYVQLALEANGYQLQQYIRPRLSVEALKTFPLDDATDPAFRRCVPWGAGRQNTARHQLEIRRVADDRIEMRYGEWDAKRTVYMDGRKRPANAPPTAMGHSVGRYDGDALIVETTGVAADRTPYRTEHSDQLMMVERYTRPADGNRLLMTLTMEDPVTLREPVVLKKVWRWAPTATITSYTDCIPATEFSFGK